MDFFFFLTMKEYLFCVDLGKVFSGYSRKFLHRDGNLFKCCLQILINYRKIGLKTRLFPSPHEDNGSSEFSDTVHQWL